MNLLLPQHCLTSVNLSWIVVILIYEMELKHPSCTDPGVQKSLLWALATLLSPRSGLCRCSSVPDFSGTLWMCTSDDRIVTPQEWGSTRVALCLGIKSIHFHIFNGSPVWICWSNLEEKPRVIAFSHYYRWLKKLSKWALFINVCIDPVSGLGAGFKAEILVSIF